MITRDITLTPKALRIARAKARLILAERGISLAFSQDYEEYRVNIKPDREATAYYTPDLDDALNTGLAMANERDRIMNEAGQ